MEKNNSSVKRQRIRTLPVKLFYELWVLSMDFENKNAYRRFVMSPESKYHNCYKKRKIQYEYFFDMLDNIYDAAHTELKDIIQQSGMKKSEMCYLFCINPRSMENWLYGKAPCPTHIKLMLLRYFGLFELGHYIYLEPEEPIQYTPKNHKPEEQEELPTIPRHSYDSLKKWEQEHVHHGDTSVQDLLARTEYLKSWTKK